MNKEQILSKLNKEGFYKNLIPSLVINGKSEALGLCPFHKDTHPSLSVNRETGLYRCFACGAKGDIFNFYMQFKGVDFPTALREMGEMAGVVEADIKSKVVATFKYTDEAGNLLYIKERLEPGRNGRSKEFIFKHLVNGKWMLGRGCDPVLYNLPELIKAKYAFIVEGEAKADLLNKWGLTATCLDSGSNSPIKDEYIQILGSMEKVIIFPDNDTPGRNYACKIANSLLGKVTELKVVDLPGLQDKGDIIDCVKIPGNNKEKLMELVKNTPEWSPDKVDKVDVLSNDENEVDTLKEITESILPITSFPMDVFPERFRETIKKLSVSFNIDSEVSASIALSVITAAVGNTVRVSPKRGWDVPLFVWMIVIAASGYGKTHPISRLVKPIDRKQAKAYRKYQELMAVYNTKMGIYRKKKEAELPTKPTLEQFKVSDTTIEALADVFEGQPRGVLIHQDELSGLVLSMNQYKNGKGSDRQHILELFNCDPWKIDRKSGSKYIPNTGASIVGGLQPQIMPKIFDQDSFNDGLLPRFLFVNAGSKPQHFSRIGISDADFVYWYDLITFCLDIPLTQNSEGYVEPKFLILSDDALNLWESFFNEYHELASFLPNRVKVFVPKLITYSLKLTGILHILKSFELKNISNVISEDTISDAIKLTRFYAGQVMVLVKQYNKPTKEFNEYENRIIQTLNKLQGQVENGKLPLSRIAEEINGMLPERLRIKDNKNIGSILRRLNLETRKSTGGVYFLIWDDWKIKKLLRTTSTTSTLSTTLTIPIEIKQGANEVESEKSLKELLDFFESKSFETTVTTITQKAEKQEMAVTEVTVVTDDSGNEPENISDEPINLDMLEVEL